MIFTQPTSFLFAITALSLFAAVRIHAQPFRLTRPRYSAKRLRALAYLSAAAGLLQFTLGVYDATHAVRTPSDILRMLAGFNFVAAGVVYLLTARKVAAGTPQSTPA